MKEPYVVNLEAPPAVIEKDATRSDAVRQRLQQIDSTVTLSTFEQGDLLAELTANDYWRDWKFESRNEYIKKSGFDMSPTQVDNLVRISTVSKVLGISLADKAKAKNTKLGIIFTLDPTKTVTDTATLKEEKMSDIMIDLVKQAPTKTVVEIKEIVKRLKGVDSTEEEVAGELTWLNLPVRRDAKQIVLDAIAVIMKFNGQTIDTLSKELKDISMAAALEKMAADTLADPNYDVDESDEEGHFDDVIEDQDYEDDSHDDTGGDDSQDESEFEEEDND